jgi:hypothetical protein
MLARQQLRGFVSQALYLKHFLASTAVSRQATAKARIGMEKLNTPVGAFGQKIAAATRPQAKDPTSA